MERKFLEDLGLEKDVIDKIMAENGKDIEAEKQKLTAQKAELDGIKKQLNEANQQIESFKGMDIEGIKKAAEDWKVKAETAELEAQKDCSNTFDYALESELLKGQKPKTIKALLNMED